MPPRSAPGCQDTSGRIPHGPAGAEPHSRTQALMPRATVPRVVPLDTSWSLCPECFATIGCEYVEEAGQVWLRKACPEHGEFQAKAWDDLDHWHWTRSFAESAGGPVGPPDGARGPDGCAPAAPQPPDASGRNDAARASWQGDAADAACCAEGRADRPRCLAVVEVTENCNLACSYCFASSRPGLPVKPKEQVEALLRTVLRESGGPTPIQLSGGEPTTRDDLPEIVAAARAMGFEHIEVNSNGLRIAQEPGYARKLCEAGATTVYLQFDGFGAEVYRPLRGVDLTETKQQAVDACREAGLQVILVPMVVPGTNEHQLGDIVRYALRNLDVVRGVNVQPVSHFGRHAEDTGHLSLPAVADLLAEQTGFLTQRDLLQVPCCSPQCSSATMLLRTNTLQATQAPGARGDADPAPPPGADAAASDGPSAVPLTRFVREDAYREGVAAFEKRNLMDLLAGRSAGVDAAVDAAGCCGVAVPAALEALLPRMLALTVTGFMDADTVDLARLDSCCINVPTAEGTLVPFCGYNLTARDGSYKLRERYRRDAVARQAAQARGDALAVVD